MKFRINRKIESSDNLLSPTPIVIDDENCLIFLGRQKRKGEPSKLSAFRMVLNHGDFKVENVEILDLNQEERFMGIGTLGELPTFSTFHGDSITLVMAGFQPEVLMKHRLAFFTETLSIEKDKTIVRRKRNFNEELLIQHSNEHTIAGASIFENELTLAYGTEWIRDNTQIVPRTEIGIVIGPNLYKHPEFNFKKMDCLALARPIRIRLNRNQVLWSVSKRLPDSRYLSEVYVETQDSKTFEKLQLEIIFDDNSFVSNRGNEFTYFFPFWWHGKLYASATSRYTGEEGFYILEQVLK